MEPNKSEMSSFSELKDNRNKFKKKKKSVIRIKTISPAHKNLFDFIRVGVNESFANVKLAICETVLDGNAFGAAEVKLLETGSHNCRLVKKTTQLKS